MNPPPPMFPASGHVTAPANATATAASTAVPPRFSTSAPTPAATGQTATTMPFFASTAGAAARAAGAKNTSPATRAGSCLMAIPLPGPEGDGVGHAEVGVDLPGGVGPVKGVEVQPADAVV